MAASSFSPISGKAYVAGPGATELRWMGDTFTYFLADGPETGGTFCLVDETARKGESVPLHKHPGDMESIYVVDGELRVFIEGRAGEAVGKGGFAHFPGGTVHGFRVLSDTARYLLLTTPRHGEFYRAITLASNADGSRPDGGVEGSVIKAACREYGIEFLGPLPPEA